VGGGYEWWISDGVVKFSFEVAVEGVDVRLDEEEHQSFLWITEEECRSRVG